MKKPIREQPTNNSKIEIYLAGQSKGICFVKPNGGFFKSLKIVVE